MEFTISTAIWIGGCIVSSGIIYLCVYISRYIKAKKKAQDGIIEFWLPGFDNGGMDVAFSHILEIYNSILYKDPLWHYFYEGDYSLIRCSKKYIKNVEDCLVEHGIKFRTPTIWKEGLYVTKKYQHIYKHIFHHTSVLAIELYKNEDFTSYLAAGDRIIHPFLNQSLYPAKAAGLCESLENSNIDFQYWEAERMSELATGRAYHIGRIVGQKEIIDFHIEKEKEEKKDEEEHCYTI